MSIPYPQNPKKNKYVSLELSINLYINCKMTQLYEESISVDQNVIGLILGKGRSNLKIIEENYNVYISLNKEWVCVNWMFCKNKSPF